MKKATLLLARFLILSCCIVSQASAQKAPFGNQIIFQEILRAGKTIVNDEVSYSVPDTAVYRVFQTFSNPVATFKSPIMLGVKLNPNLTNYLTNGVQSFSKKFTTYIISDNSPATVVGMGINPGNAKDYRYHVVENDSLEIVPWSPVSNMEQKYGAKIPYAAFGTFSKPGKQIMVEVVNVNNYSIREGVIFDFRTNFRPFVNNISSGLAKLIQPDKFHEPSRFFALNDTAVFKKYVTKFDPKTGLPLDLNFPAGMIDGFTLSLDKHPTVTYSFHLIRQIKGLTDTVEINPFMYMDAFDLEGRYFKDAGKYQLIIQRQGLLGSWPEDQIIRMPFTVDPPPLDQKKVSLKQLIPYTIAILAGFAIVFFMYRSQSKIKLAKADQQKELANLKLNAVRSQLNPHFMFNALTSIQNLMNQRDTEGANHYLSKFAILTRHALETSGQELISLKDELAIVTDYLEMEQLRFGFNYTINVDPAINTANTEIPAMLLQPFIENAAKHGVSALQGKGKIDVQIAMRGQNLVLTVSDNGPGISSTTNTISGFGLKLSDERIALLNGIYKTQPILLNIDSSTSGATITITLTNWA